MNNNVNRGEAMPMSEQEMREADVPTPETEVELLAYIKALVDRPHDYGTCVYAMSMAATAAFQYVAHKLGVTGFQAGCADMDVLRRTRSLKHGFRIVDYGNLLYPQYWDKDDGSREVFQAALREPETRERFREAAKKLLAESKDAHPDVVKHWKSLANGRGIA